MAIVWLLCLVNSQLINLQFLNHERGGNTSFVWWFSFFKFKRLNTAIFIGQPPIKGLNTIAQFVIYLYTTWWKIYKTHIILKIKVFTILYLYFYLIWADIKDNKRYSKLKRMINFQTNLFFLTLIFLKEDKSWNALIYYI